MHQFTQRVVGTERELRAQRGVSASSLRSERGVNLHINDWSTDGRGIIRASAVIDWKAEAVTADGSGDVFLRIEFSVDPDRTDVSSLQFRLTEQQAKHLGAKLASISNQSPQSSGLFSTARQCVST